MKLASFRIKPDARPTIGVLFGEDRLIELQPSAGDGHFSSMNEFLEIGEKGLAQARAAVRAMENGKSLTRIHSVKDVELLAPVPRPGKILHTACNFKSHLSELTTWSAPEWQAHKWENFHYEHPTGFLEAPSSVVGTGATVDIPIFTNQLDYEVEIGIVIGKPARNVPVESALDYVAGYTIFNDLSARDIQAREHANKVILLGKSFEGSCPFGPYLVTRDEFPDNLDLRMTLLLNDNVRQDASTAQMRYSPRELVAWWSLLRLEPGDIITSGSPPGVIAGSADPQWLKAGDRLDAVVESLGTLTTFIGEKAE